MLTMIKQPPPILGTACLLEFAIIDPSVVFTGHQTLYVDGKLLGAVPHLAVCRDLGSEELYMFHCDRKWNVIAVSGSGTITEIKETAERAYRGFSTKWTMSPYTEDQISQYLLKTWGKLRCSFCQQWPWNIQKIFKGTNTYICGECVRSFCEL